MATSVGLIFDNPCAFPGISWGYFVAAFSQSFSQERTLLGSYALILCRAVECVQGQKINLLSLTKTELGDSICHRKDSVRHPWPVNKQDGAIQAPWHRAENIHSPEVRSPPHRLMLARCPLAVLFSEPNCKHHLLSTSCCARPGSGCQGHKETTDVYSE